MEKLLSILLSAMNRDLAFCTKITMSEADYTKIIASYQNLPFPKQEKFIESVNKKLKKEQKNREILNLLIFYEYLLEAKEDLCFAFPADVLERYENKSKITSKRNIDKNQLADNNFIQFYLQYLKEKIWKANHLVMDIDINNLKQSLHFCEAALNSMKLLIRYDFVIGYVITHSELQSQAKIITLNSLRRASEDLAFLIKFVDKWNYKISQDNYQSICVNNIYEQLIYMNRNIPKLQVLAKKLQSSVQFPRYLLNEKLNKTISQFMMSKDSQMKISSEKIMKSQYDCLYEQAEITQCQLFKI